MSPRIASPNLSGSPRAGVSPLGVLVQPTGSGAGGVRSPRPTRVVDDLEAARRAYNAHVPGCPLCTTTEHCELGALLDTHVSQLFARRLMRAVEA
jgi:hypothetical protein